MYAVKIIGADGLPEDRVKFFERLTDARAYARGAVQEADRAAIYDASKWGKPSIRAAIKLSVHGKPIETFGRRATDREIQQHEKAVATAFLKKLGFNA